MKDFRDLVVWQKAHDVALRVYQFTRPFPTEERYGLTAQLRRSASSIGANIAEGCGRGSDADFRRFLHIAMGSASELEYHLLLSRDLHYLGEKEYQSLNGAVTEVKRMLTSLIQKLTADG